MKNVLLIKGFSQYDAMCNYIDEIEIGFRLAGYNTYLIDSKDESYELQIEELSQKEKINIIFTCNIILTEVRRFFTEAYYLTYLCDHPATHLQRLIELDDKSIVFVCDRRHENYIKKYCKNISKVKFVPLSGSYSKKYIPYIDRKYGVVFTGSYCKPEIKYKEILDDAGDMQEFAKYLAKSIIDDPKQDLEMCLDNALYSFDMKISDEKFHELAAHFCTVNQYARAFYRDKMIRSLLEYGIKVHVFGNGWDTYDGSGRENLIIEKGNYYIAQKMVANAKISINIMPWFKEGFQERIATAMLSGTVAVTDESDYICEHYDDGKELVLYSLNQINLLPEKIDYLLKNPEIAEKIAQAGKNQAITWQDRVIDMMTYAITLCPDLYPNAEGKCGETKQVSYRQLHSPLITKDAISSMKKIIEMIEQVQLYDTMSVEDLMFFYKKFFDSFQKVMANFPEINGCISGNIYKYISNCQETQCEVATELLLKECLNILAVFQSKENIDLLKENRRLLIETNKLNRELERANRGYDTWSQRILIKKIVSNYKNEDDQYLKEILDNIKKWNCVEAYNQNFVEKYTGLSQEEYDEIHYDEQAEMCYALWNGKKMYYPKGYTKQDVASAINFVKLEQDEESPHKYLDTNFEVPDDAIVIDAGVAEGNFALDVVERAKKVYLVECEHKWVEALKKTFEPWKEKVTIIEKMLGEKTDDQFANIDDFVQEGYVNFIKMDVEGAEIPSLLGASKILENSRNVRCAICAYHRKNAETDIRNILEKYNFYTKTTKGYMFFKEDLDSWIDGELRHGLVRAEKI